MAAQAPGYDTREAIRGVRGMLIRHSRAFEPMVSWLGHRPTRQPQDRLVAYAHRHRLPYCDVLATLEGQKAEVALAAFNDASHFSELGHALTAELLAEPVAQLVGCPGSGSRLSRNAIRGTVEGVGHPAALSD